MRDITTAQSSAGFTLIEVLITFLVLAIGLLGLAGLQVNTLSNQFETYQRAQAVMLAEDMANRIRVDAIAARAGAYADGNEYGLLDEADCTVITTSADRYLCEWNNTLAGAGVAQGAQKLGSIIGARGCIENFIGDDDIAIIRVTIAWQGSTPTIAPASTCGQGLYGAVDPNDPDDPGDRYRRTASVDVVLANLAL
jgi:type IV pilus assembly protein PilV